MRMSRKRNRRISKIGKIRCFFGMGVFDWQLVSHAVEATWRERSYNEQRWWGDFPRDAQVPEDMFKAFPPKSPENRLKTAELGLNLHTMADFRELRRTQMMQILDSLKTLKTPLLTSKTGFLGLLAKVGLEPTRPFGQGILSPRR